MMIAGTNHRRNHDTGKRERLMRIVSLIPGATETICLLGLQDQLVGVTHECDFPAAVAGLPKVTRTLIPADASSAEIDTIVRRSVRERMPLYQLDLPTLFALRPDLIVTQALCDVCAVDETELLRAACSMLWRPKIVNLEPDSLQSVLDAIDKVAAAARIPDIGTDTIRLLEGRIRAVSDRSEHLEHRTSVVFLEWLDPLFCAGHWNPELVELAGGRDCIGRAGERSHRIEWEEVVRADPEALVIACCGYPVDRALVDFTGLQCRPGWSSLKAVRTERVYVVDGSSYFNRPGPRLVDSLEILAHALHPNVHPAPTLHYAPAL